tara:strand:+ start:17402 stop:17758 length:357 start_codon:yes stop_codon:yes gene_type:complete
MFRYNCTVARVVDGDTIDALIDLGFSVIVKKRIRFYGINAPESRTRDKEEKKRGLAAKARLKEMLNENGNEFVLQSHGVGKYGRCLGELFLKDEDQKSVQRILIEEGHGEEYYGGKRS